MTSALLYELVQVLRSTTELKGLDLWLMDDHKIAAIYTLLFLKSHHKRDFSAHSRTQPNR